MCELDLLEMSLKLKVNTTKVKIRMVIVQIDTIVSLPSDVIR